MHAIKPAASLTAGLLARRGGAKPAMRRAGVGIGPLDDLGWNDLGPPPAPAAPSPVAEQIATIVAGLNEAEPTTTAGRKAAFTLRLDAERHLRLRLLSAVTHQSAQALLIAALDALIARYPDVDGLARDPKVRGAGSPRSDQDQGPGTASCA